VTQVSALARAFLARFFESDITTGADDLKQSFFWLLAALAMPGIFIPWLMVFEWNWIGMFYGFEALRNASRAEKVFYLGVSMLSSGALTAVVWSSLLPDRRDTLILGALPVRPHVVVLGKLAALAAYLGIVSAGMHAGGSIFWGSILGANAPFTFMVMGIVGHFLVCSAISVTTMLAVAGVQGILLTVLGPRLYGRASTLLQVVVVGLLAVILSWLPAMTSATPATIKGGVGAQPWILSMPPLWFLGLYEWTLGTNDPVLLELARRAMLALAGCVGVALVTYPLAYRRLMVSVVESGGRERGALARASQSGLVRLAGRNLASRAAADFFVSTVARVERQRFVLAIALGLALAWSLPGLRSFTASAMPHAAVLGLPIASMLFLLVGLRTASSLPADPRAGWLFEVHDISRRDARRALERMLIVLGVVPPLLLSTPIYWYLWGPGVALTHAIVMSALGVTVTELLLWHCSGMPCGQPLVPARMGFGRKWPLHAALFLIAVLGIPALEVLLFRSWIGTGAFVANLIAIAIAVRLASARHQIVPSYEEVDPVAGVLRLG
jgi:hypothetical protein